MTPTLRTLDHVERRGTVITWSAGLCAGAAALAAFARPATWLFIGLLVIAGSALLLMAIAGVPDLLAWTNMRRQGHARRSKPLTPAFTDRWRYTPNGMDAASAMTCLQKTFTHPAYRPNYIGQGRPPSVRLSAVVAVEPLGPTPTTSDLRAAFRNWLGTDPVDRLARRLTHVPQGRSWISYAGNGRTSNEGILADGPGDEQIPSAFSLLILREEGSLHFAHDRRCAELLLHIDCLPRDGASLRPLRFAEWHELFQDAVCAVSSFASFLHDTLGIPTVADPPTQFGIQLQGVQSLRELVDPEQLAAVPGAHESRSYTALGYAARDGSDPDAIALVLLRSMCDHGLHLDGYESHLLSLASGTRGSHPISEQRRDA